MTPSGDQVLAGLLAGFEGPVFVVDREGRHGVFNEAHRQRYRELYGVDPQPGSSVLDPIPSEEGRRQFRADLDRALGGEAFSVHQTFPDAQGHRHTFRVNLMPIRPGGDAVDAVLVVCLDTTEPDDQRRTGLEALEAAQIATWSYDGNSGATTFSDRYYTLLGYRPGEFAATLEAWVERIHPDDAQAALAGFRTFIQTQNEAFHLEFRMRTKSGGWKWLLGQAQVVERDHRSLPIRVVGTNQDITQRKLVEQALRESEARWTNLVDQAPAGVTILGPDGTVQFVNRYEAQFHDSDAVGRPWKDLLPPELGGLADQILHQGFHRKSATEFHSWKTGPGDSRIDFDSQVRPIVEDGRVTALLIISLDVTAQFRISERRRKAARRLEILVDLQDDAHSTRQKLLDAALDAAVELTDSEIGYIYFYDELTETFTLYSWSKTVMDQCRVTEPQTSYELGLTGYWGEAVRQRRPILVNDFQVPSSFHRGLPTGHVPVRRFLTVPVFQDEAIVAVVGVGNKLRPYDDDDVVELQLLAESLWRLQDHKEAEAALARLSLAVEHAPVSVVVTDPEGTIAYANARVYALTGYRPDEVLGHNPRLFQSGKVAPPVYQDLWSTILSGREWQGEMVNRKKNGELFTESVSISPVFDSAGAVTGFVAVKEDITERQRSQNLLFQAQKMETIGQLAAGVAHDFNNYLTSILAYNQVLLMKLTGDNPDRQLAEKIAVSGGRAASLVAGLLAVGRRQRLTKSRVDLNALLREDAELLNSVTRGKAELVLDLSPSPVYALVDPGPISQAVVNLISNAKDALGTGGRIRVVTGHQETPDGYWARLSVEDNGPGVPPAVRDRIFEPFFTTKQIGQGTGMGLSIVQGVVHQHGGSIALEDPEGGGARFVILLPEDRDKAGMGD